MTEAFVDTPPPELVQPAAEMVDKQREEDFNIHAGASYQHWRKTGEISDDLLTGNPPAEADPLDANDIEARVAMLDDEQRYEYQLSGKLPRLKEDQQAENSETAGDGTATGEGETTPEDHTARYLAMPTQVQEWVTKDAELQRLQLRAASLPQAPLPDAIKPAAEVFRHAFADLKNPQLVYRHLALGDPLLFEDIYKALHRGERGATAVVATLRMLDSELPKALTSNSAKTVTDAPPPPKEVGGRGTAMGDPATQAVKDGDFASYQRAMNARDTAPLRSRRSRQ